MFSLLNEEFNVGGKEGIVVGDVASRYVSPAGQQESLRELSCCLVYGGGCGEVKVLQRCFCMCCEGRPVDLLVVKVCGAGLAPHTGPELDREDYWQVVGGELPSHLPVRAESKVWC